MFSRSHHGRRSYLSWSSVGLVVTAILAGVIVMMAVVIGLKRRSVSELVGRAGLRAPSHEQPHEPDPPSRSGAEPGTETPIQPGDASLSDVARTIAAEISAESEPNSVPADGASVCPIEYPIKGNGRSGIYHPPGAFAYERTIPSICFRSTEAAERAGFRAARH